MRSKTLALKAARLALDKGAQAVQILDLRGKVDYTDHLVLCSGTSTRHVSSVAEAVEEGLRRAKVRAVCVEGFSTGSWALLDYVDVVVHVFLEEVRAYYDLEGLWLDAPRIPPPGEEPPAAKRPSRPRRRAPAGE